MHILRTVLEILAYTFNFWMICMMVYQIVLSLFGFGKGTKDYADREPESRFLVLVPAHNEEKVIADIIKNLQQMAYPKHLYDFFVIADNCSDDTAQVARDMGANVIVTRRKGSGEPTGKPIALKKALRMLGDYQERYDLLMIFDADNLIDPNLFAEVNSQFLEKDRPEVIQCYLGAKNKTGLIAWFYYTCFTTSNRFAQLSRMRRGLNCGIGGTGYAMSTQYLHERGGWTAVSLTEDFEIQIEATLQGKRILWNHNARIYDEKPTTVAASLRQRIRWAQGQWYVCFRNAGKIIPALKSKTISLREVASMLMYMCAMFANVFVLFQVCLSIIYFALGWGSIMTMHWMFQYVSIGIFVYSLIGLFYTADYHDNSIRPSVRTLPLMLVSTALNLLLAMLAQFIGLLLHRRQNQWVKTEHSLNLLECQEEECVIPLIENDTYATDLLGKHA